MRQIRLGFIIIGALWGELGWAQPGVLALQRHTLTQSQKFGTGVQARLVNLNEKVGRWFLLEVSKGGKTHFFHLENPAGRQQNLQLKGSFPRGLVLKKGLIEKQCPLWSSTLSGELFQAAKASKPYVALCGGKIYLRNKIEGYRTTKEWVVEFLRDEVWGGEAITTMVKNTFFKDKYLIKAGETKNASQDSTEQKNFPTKAEMDSQEGGAVVPDELGITLKSAPSGGMLMGHFYEVKDGPGLYVSVMKADLVSKEILKSFPNRVNKLDRVESEALVYLLAFDLDLYAFHYELGTEHPRVDWSYRVPRTPASRTIPGPDGIGSIEPLVGTGMVNPFEINQVVATFTGGFKRGHGAFRSGALAHANSGSHYGFVENGVVLSRLHPDLATLIIDYEGNLRLKTWTATDTLASEKVRHARQNGVPLIEPDPKAKAGRPGLYVGNWGLGNWSGDENSRQRTLRAGLCTQTNDMGKRFAIYGYFSSVTPNAMARIFQSYQCDYAIHLDMNALEHTYLARYVFDPKMKSLVPETLIKGMAVLDQRYQGNVPRFIGYPDNRDFFYVVPKSAGH